MKELVLKSANGQNVTTSLLVAEKFDKEHKHVLEAIRKILTAENSAVLNMFFESTYYNEQNKEQPMFYMNRDGFSLLVMGFTGDKALKFKIEFIEAFNQMEKAVKSIDLLSRKEIALMLVEAEEEKERLQLTAELQAKELKASAPKVEFYENVLQSKNTYTTTQVAKEIGFRHAEQLHLELKSRGIMFKQSGQWMLTAKYTGNGYTKPRTSNYIKEDGTQGTNTITVWTEKGREFIHSLIKVEQLQEV